jgi:hypothetical protein
MKKPVFLLAVATAGLFAAAPVTANGPHERMLSAVVGQGSGTAEVRFSSADVGLSAEITVNIHGTVPNTVFYLQRAPEIGRPLGSDGICQRALGLWPWEQPNSAGFPAAPVWVALPRPLPGDLKTLTTDADGSGSAHLSLKIPTIADGTTFDLVFRVSDSLTAPANDLRTGCFTVTAK